MFSYATDLPLIDNNPIDFGLQEFCKGCKKCAEVCPAQSISYDEEPSWDMPERQDGKSWHQPGKKVYWEEPEKCISQIFRSNTMCGICLSECPWNKQDETILHEIVQVVSSKLPQMSSLIKELDDAFGYGGYYVNEDLDKIAEWWTMPINRLGMESPDKIVR